MKAVLKGKLFKDTGKQCEQHWLTLCKFFKRQRETYANIFERIYKELLKGFTFKEGARKGAIKYFSVL